MVQHLDFKEINLEDKNLFDNFFHEFLPLTSEFTFTNLFCWRKPKKHEFCMIEGHLLISFDSRKRFYQPVGKDPAGVIKKVLDIFPESSFERVEKRVADKLSSEFNVAEDRNHFDYVYLISDLINMSGRRFAGQRNFINRFKSHNPKVCVLDKGQVPGFIRLHEKWHSQRDYEADDSLIGERDALNNALKYFEELGLSGICIKVKGEIEAFAIGEALNDDTYVEHFEKASTHLTGIYQFLLNEYVKTLPEKAKFLNREQDLGIAGLRKSKLSYNPIRMIEKYSVRK